MSNLQRWGDFDDTALAEESARVDALSGSKYIDLPQGDTVLRFLPPPVGRSNPFRSTQLHYVELGQGPDKKKLSFACPRVELKQPCLVCMKIEELSRSLNPRDKELAKAMQPKLRVLANVVNRSMQEPVVQILGFGKTIWEALREIRANPRKGGNYVDPIGGFDIIITKEGTGLETRYSVFPDREVSRLAASDADIINLIESQHNLDAEITPLVPEALVELWGDIAYQQSGRGDPRSASVARPPQRAPAGGVGAGVFRQPQRSALDDARVVQTTGTVMEPDDGIG